MPLSVELNIPKIRCIVYFDSDNQHLYLFDVKTHLMLEDFPLGLLEGETIKKVSVSGDGKLMDIILNNDNRAESSKFYWMHMPSATGTPL